MCVCVFVCQCKLPSIPIVPKCNIHGMMQAGPVLHILASETEITVNTHTHTCLPCSHTTQVKTLPLLHKTLFNNTYQEFPNELLYIYIIIITIQIQYITLFIHTNHSLFQRFIQVDIHGYSPSPGDLAYPDKLVVAVSF